MSESAPKSYSLDPSLYIYTSLTAGSSHIVTATSRLETILKANRIPFKAIDIATDEKARMLWGRRAGKDESGRARKLPGLVQEGLVLGDLVEIEEWNEYRELKQHVKIVTEGATWVPPPLAKMTKKTTTKKTTTVKKENVKPTPALAESSKDPPSKEEPKLPAAEEQNSISLALRQVGQEAAQKAKEAKTAAVKVITGTGTTDTESKKEEESPEKVAVAEKDLKEPAAIPPPVDVDAPKDVHVIEDAALMQSPTSTAWKRAAGGNIASAVKSEKEHVIEDNTLMQSPTSSAWKRVPGGNIASVTESAPVSPIVRHRGSEVSQASAEEIKKIEDECTIKEEENEDAVEG